jgi:uncharacterized protein YbbC (DUF1343 family)
MNFSFRFVSYRKIVCLCLLFLPIVLQGQEIRQGIDIKQLSEIDAAVLSEIEAGELPGAVVLVTHRGETIYRKAFGHRAVRPLAEPMTVDTIFDLASLTKVIATAPSVMALVEEGVMRLRDPVSRYVPDFERYGKEAVTIEHLLTHVSGLRPDFPLEQEFEGTEIAVQRATEELLEASPGERFIYSDINFLLLGAIVERVSGQSLAEFSHRRIFAPLGMTETFFHPPALFRDRIAPTEACGRLAWPCGGPDAEMLRGTVHDPTARRMGGIAGHAGLFGTADDLAQFGAMVLGGGRLSEETPAVLSPLTVARMTTPATSRFLNEQRGLGWDIDSRYSSNRGDLFSSRSFGHTGFTGTSIWIDPDTSTVVVFLSNRVHPDGDGNVTRLRGRVATLVAAAVGDGLSDSVTPPVSVDQRQTLTGLDVLVSDQFAQLVGRSIGLLTNHTGRDRLGRSTVDLLNDAAGVELKALFSPEHGIRGFRDDAVNHSRHPATDLPIYSLYGPTRRPTNDMLMGLDTVVVDLQDVGTRFYTYATTMAYMMEMAATQDISIVVLDRPNPITGTRVEGPLLDGTEETTGFTGYFSMPVRHGLTMGELALLFNHEKRINAQLTVIPMRGWRRTTWFDETGLPWVNPSPNLRSVAQATLYPGIGVLEQTNISVGRGTDTPFEQLGAPWVDGVELARVLNSRGIEGAQVYPVAFTPSSSKYSGQWCEGISVLVTDRSQFRPVRLGVEIASALFRLHPNDFDLDALVRLSGSSNLVERIRGGDDPESITGDWEVGENVWRQTRRPHLIYP